MMSAPIMIIISMALIVKELGPIGLIAPLLFFIGAIFQKNINTAALILRKNLLKFSDQRSKSVNEFFEGIRIIKVTFYKYTTKITF